MNFLKSRRMAMKISQADLANMLGASQQTVARWERNGPIPAKYLGHLAIITESNVQEFLDFPDHRLLRNGPVSALLPYYVGRTLTHDEESNKPFGDVQVRYSSAAGCGSKCYPISSGSKLDIQMLLDCVGHEPDADVPWIQFETLNNKWVAVNTGSIDGITFVDDNVEKMTPFEHAEFYKAVAEFRRTAKFSEAELAEPDAPYSAALAQSVSEYCQSMSGADLDADFDSMRCEFFSGEKWVRTLSDEATQTLLTLFSKKHRTRKIVQFYFPHDGAVECVRLGAVRLIEAPLQQVLGLGLANAI